MLKSIEMLERAIDENWNVDLHSHSIHSDGAWTPTDLIADAQAAGIKVFALTDHDSVAGLPEAQQAASACDIVLIPGAEISLKVEDRPYHVLCYGLDPAGRTWQRVSALRQAHQVEYYADVFDQIRQRGYEVRLDDVRLSDGSFERSAATVALVRAGHCGSTDEAGRLLRSLGLNYPWQKLSLDVEEFAGLMEHNAAVCVVAHVARHEHGVSTRLTEHDLEHLRAALPLVGLETHHPYHRPDDVESYCHLAAKNNLMVTTGSDAHGHRVGRPPRPHPAELSAPFLRLILARWKEQAIVASNQAAR